ncbi:MAG: iron(III) transport system substrate-binding protein [Pseudonocardiales bacterium]|jgi:iron(III) transport system substrate-binding protein|nr:iron(III) transport system substrate-binding protein [Pseudonocardiales bacterium]
MRTFHRSRPVIALLAVAGLAAGCGSSSSAGSPGGAGGSGSNAPLSAVEKVTKYTGADREQYLYSCAKTEGSVVLYTSSSAILTYIKPAFEKKYPGVTLTPYVGTTDLVQHLTEEEDAGKHIFDVYGDIYGNLERTSKYFARISSPNSTGLYPAQNNPYYFGVNGFVMGAAYNTKLVSAADAPKSYQDLADPKWKGKIAGGFDTSTPISYQVVKSQIGNDLMNKFAANVKVTEGVSARGVGDLMEAGTFPIAWSVPDSYQKADGIAKGAPFQFIPLSPMVSFYSTYSVSAHAPHPCAATLLLDWSLDQKAGGGQQTWASHGDTSPFSTAKLVPFDIPGTDPSTWKLVESADPAIVDKFSTYREAAAKYTVDFRNQFIRK